MIIFSKLKSWASKNILSCKAVGFISGLVFGSKFVDFAVLSILITYFTDSSKYNLRKAAAFVNVEEGLSASLGIVIIYISAAFPSPLIHISFSTAFYIAGLVLMYLTSSHHLFRESMSEPFNVIGVVLLAVGEAGVNTLLKPYLEDQMRAHDELEKDKDHGTRERVRRGVPWLCGIVAAFITTMFYSWPELFIISAGVMGIAFFLFLCGISFHRRELGDRGCPINIFGVIKASISKRHVEYPTSPNQFFCKDGNFNRLCLSPDIKTLRWLDKAAIIEGGANHDDPEAQANGGRLCDVTQVQQVKLLLTMVPMWTSFLVFGLVLSAGNTYFPEQGNNMESPVNFIVLLIIPSISRKIMSFLSKVLFSKWDLVAKKKAQVWRIRFGMALSICCCQVAWRVEVRRLSMLKEKGLVDKPDDFIIPMSILWLVPQFCLKGLMRSFASDGLGEFMNIDQFSESTDCITAINEFVIGIGGFLNIFFAYANRSDFADTLNHSRLDEYYKKLALVSFVNFCCYCVISNFYMKHIHFLVPDATFNTGPDRRMEVGISERSGPNAV